MNPWVAVFVYLLAGGIIGYLVSRIASTVFDGHYIPRKEVKRQNALRALQVEYEGKVDPSLLVSVGHSPHSPEYVRQILDEQIEITAKFDEMLDDLRRERN